MGGCYRPSIYRRFASEYTATFLTNSGSRAEAGKRTVGLGLNTFAYEILIRVNGMSREAKVNEGFVHGISHVSQRIKQRAIEVEKNSFEHRRSARFMFLRRSRRGI